MNMPAKKLEFDDDGFDPMTDLVDDADPEGKADDVPVDPDKKAAPLADDDDIEVEIVDVTPPQDRDRQPPEGIEDLDSEEHQRELEALNNEKIKQRFQQYTYRANEERRRAERLERELAAATEMANRWRHENSAIRRQMIEAGAQHAVARREQIDAEIASTRSLIAKATEDGDGVALAAAQERMGMLTAEKVSLANRAARPAAAPQQPQQLQQPQQPQPRRQPPQVDPNTQAWVERNPWFMAPGNDRIKAFAQGVDRELQERGMTPADPGYFREIDKALRETFPKQFPGKAKPKTPPVAGARRSGSPGASKTVTLTKDEVALARRMGVSVEDYAREKRRLEKAGEI